MIGTRCDIQWLKRAVDYFPPLRNTNARNCPSSLTSTLIAESSGGRHPRSTPDEYNSLSLFAIMSGFKGSGRAGEQSFRGIVDVKVELPDCVTSFGHE